MTDGRLSSLATLHIHKQKDVIDIDGVITDFPGLKGAHLARLRPWWPHCFTFCRKQSVPYRSSLFTENGLQKTQEMAFHFPDPKFEKFVGEHAPSRPPCLGRLGLANFSSPACTFKISCYTANYRHLIAYEINAQGWKKRLSLEGVGMVWGGGGGYILKFVIVKRGGTIFICNYFGGVQFWYTTLLHFSEPPLPPTPLGRNKRTVPNKSHLGKLFARHTDLYRIYSINRPGRLLHFWTLRVGAYSRLGAY